MAQQPQQQQQIQQQPQVQPMDMGGSLPMSPAQQMAIQQMANQQRPFGWLTDILSTIFQLQQQQAAPTKQPGGQQTQQRQQGATGPQSANQGMQMPMMAIIPITPLVQQAGPGDQQWVQQNMAQVKGSASKGGGGGGMGGLNFGSLANIGGMAGGGGGMGGM